MLMSCGHSQQCRCPLELVPGEMPWSLAGETWLLAWVMHSAALRDQDCLEQSFGLLGSPATSVENRRLL